MVLGGWGSLMERGSGEEKRAGLEGNIGRIENTSEGRKGGMEGRRERERVRECEERMYT